MVIPSVHHPALEVCIVQPQMGKLRDAYWGTANIDDVMQIFPRINKDPTLSVRDLKPCRSLYFWNYHPNPNVDAPATALCRAPAQGLRLKYQAACPWSLIAKSTLHVELVTEARGLQAECATTIQVLQAPHAVCTFWPKGDKLEVVIILISFCIGAPQPLYTRAGFWKSWPWSKVDTAHIILNTSHGWTFPISHHKGRSLLLENKQRSGCLFVCNWWFCISAHGFALSTPFAAVLPQKRSDGNLLAECITTENVSFDVETI